MGSNPAGRTNPKAPGRKLRGLWVRGAGTGSNPGLSRAACVGSENPIGREIAGLSTTQSERVLMGEWLRIAVWSFTSALRGRRDLALENVALPQQLMVI